jgi:integrative and conjugative element protein (TIGR02256 family)
LSRILTLSSGGRLKITDTAWVKMVSLRQDTLRKKEAGGLLLGRQILESDDLVIDDVSTPVRGDTRARMRFVRSKRHQRFVDEAWAKSNGTRVYLGEWHTHPEGVPSPSSEDLRSWRKHLSDKQIHGEALFFVIVGVDAVRVWEGFRFQRSVNLIGEVCLHGQESD